MPNPQGAADGTGFHRLELFTVGSDDANSGGSLPPRVELSMRASTICLVGLPFKLVLASPLRWNVPSTCPELPSHTSARSTLYTSSSFSCLRPRSCSAVSPPCPCPATLPSLPLSSHLAPPVPLSSPCPRFPCVTWSLAYTPLQHASPGFATSAKLPGRLEKLNYL